MPAAAKKRPGSTPRPSADPLGKLARPQFRWLANVLEDARRQVNELAADPAGAKLRNGRVAGHLASAIAGIRSAMPRPVPR